MPSPADFMSDKQKAEAFANSPEVQAALRGQNPGYATSILWRAGLRGTNNPHESPEALAVYRALAQQLAQNPTAWAQAHDPANDWAGKSHNFFVQNPWAAPIAEIGTALIPGVGPVAAAGIDAAIGGISHANIGSGVHTPGYGSATDILGGAGSGAALGYGVNKLAGQLGGGDLPSSMDPTSPNYDPNATFDTSGVGALGGSGLGSLGKLGQVAGLGLAGASTISGAAQQAKANAILDQALQQAQQNYAQLAPLRANAVTRFGQTPAPFQVPTLVNRANPFGAQPAAVASRPLQPLSVGGAI